MGKTGGTLVAILAGAAVGAVAGVLLAPDQGSKTRKKIKDGIQSGTEDLSCKFDELKKQVKSLMKSKQSDLESSINEFVSQAGSKSEDVIVALEKKLAELKKGVSEKAEAVKNQVK